MVLLFLSVGGCGGSSSALPDVPDLTLPTTDGGSLRLADYAGKVLLVEFWATWCAPCRLQADILDAVYDDFSGRDVEFLAVSLGEDESTVVNFTRDNPFPYPVAMDVEESLGASLGIYVLPTVIVMNREGRVSYQRPGVSSGEALRKALLDAGAALASPAG